MNGVYLAEKVFIALPLDEDVVKEMELRKSLRLAYLKKKINYLTREEAEEIKNLSIYSPVF
jgi:hypothetical protein